MVSGKVVTEKQCMKKKATYFFDFRIPLFVGIIFTLTGIPLLISIGVHGIWPIIIGVFFMILGSIFRKSWEN